MTALYTNRPQKDTIMTETKQPANQLENVGTKIQERRDNLIYRQSYLKDKILTLERTIPALLAYNMWMTGQQCRNPPHCKVRELMSKFSPRSDPTEKLLEYLQNTLENLNKETTELHNKIIAADVQLEEIGMELESVELGNKELNEKIAALEKEMEHEETPSVHSIQSEDIMCLSKIRQFAKEERILKSAIRELEEKEASFQKEMGRLLSSREFQIAMSRSKRMLRQKRELDFVGSKARCTCPRQLYTQKNLMRKQNGATQIDGDRNVSSSGTNIKCQTNQREKKSTWISAWLGSQQKSPAIERTPTLQKTEKIPPPLTKDETKACICSTPASTLRHTKSTVKAVDVDKSLADTVKTHCTTSTMTKTCNCTTYYLPGFRKTYGSSIKSKHICSKSPFCEPSTYIHSPMRPNTCYCNCTGKCARGLSDVACACGLGHSSTTGKGYQPIASEKTTEDVNNDDEFCECCSYGCEEDDQVSCLCD